MYHQCAVVDAGLVRSSVVCRSDSDLQGTNHFNDVKKESVIRTHGYLYPNTYPDTDTSTYSKTGTSVGTQGAIFALTVANSHFLF